MALRKAGANWVEGEDRFFDRKSDLAALVERVRDGTHTLVTAQRRMGKTSLVRELLRRLEQEGKFETVFVDIEGADSASDAIAEIGAGSMSVQGARRRMVTGFANALREVGERIHELSFTEIRVKLRAGIDAGSWRRRGDEVFAALAANDRPVVLAIDELPILVDRLLRFGGESIAPEGIRAADAFMSWLRKNGQAHRDRVILILSGSVSLEPILRRAGLSAQANIFSPYDLKPWDESTADACLGELADTYGLDLPSAVRGDMCGRLRCAIPHHVQLFFDCLHEHLRRSGRCEATMEDVEGVYRDDMLGARGQMDLDHYETRLKSTLGNHGYRIALDLLTGAAVEGGLLRDDAVGLYHEYFEARNPEAKREVIAVEEVLRQLEHDGYLDRGDEGFKFVSGLLEDWWRARHGRYFMPIAKRQA